MGGVKLGGHSAETKQRAYRQQYEAAIPELHGCDARSGDGGGVQTKTGWEAWTKYYYRLYRPKSHDTSSTFSVSEGVPMTNKLYQERIAQV